MSSSGLDPVTRRRWLGASLAAVTVSGLTACATTDGALSPAATEIADSAWAQNALGAESAPWQHKTFPGKKPNRMTVRNHDGRLALAVQSRASLSVLRKAVSIEASRNLRLRFTWAAEAPATHANIGTREHDDSPLRLVLTFDGDRALFSPRNTALSDLALALTGEPMPYATLMYVWCPSRPVNESVVNPRTDRIRSVVAQTGAQSARRWQSISRNVSADFASAFGEAPGQLIGVGLMTDTDNTQTEVQAWYGSIELDHAA